MYFLLDQFWCSKAIEWVHRTQIEYITFVFYWSCAACGRQRLARGRLETIHSRRPVEIKESERAIFHSISSNGGIVNIDKTTIACTPQFIFLHRPFVYLRTITHGVCIIVYAFCGFTLLDIFSRFGRIDNAIRKFSDTNNKKEASEINNKCDFLRVTHRPQYALELTQARSNRTDRTKSWQRGFGIGPDFLFVVNRMTANKKKLNNVFFLLFEWCSWTHSHRWDDDFTKRSTK